MMFLRSASQKNAFLSHFDTVLSHFCPHFDVKMPQKAPFWPQRTLKTTQKGAFWVKNSTFFFWAWKAVFKVPESEKRILSQFDTVLSNLLCSFLCQKPKNFTLFCLFFNAFLNNLLMSFPPTCFVPGYFCAAPRAAPILVDPWTPPSSKFSKFK